MVVIQAEPMLDELRSDPRYAARDHAAEIAADLKRRFAVVKYLDFKSVQHLHYLMKN